MMYVNSLIAAKNFKVRSRQLRGYLIAINTEQLITNANDGISAFYLNLSIGLTKSVWQRKVGQVWICNTMVVTARSRNTYQLYYYRTCYLNVTKHCWLEFIIQFRLATYMKDYK